MSSNDIATVTVSFYFVFDVIAAVVGGCALNAMLASAISVRHLGDNIFLLRSRNTVVNHKQLLK